MAKATQNSGPFSVLYLLLFALMPFVYVDSLVDNTLVPRQVFTSVVLLVLAGIVWQKSTREKLGLGPVLLFFLGFLLINIISVTAAINPVESWAIITRYLVGFSFLAISIFLLRSGRLKPQQLVMAVVLFGGITALITLVNLLQALGSGDFIADIYTVSGTFGHKNLLSSALMLSFPFAVMGAIVLSKPAWRRLSLILALILVAEMFVLRTRGVWLSMFLGTIVCLVVYFVIRRSRKSTVRFPFKWVGIGAVLALVILVGLFASKGFRENIVDRSTLNRRVVFWQNSMEMIEEHPVIGVGAGNWRINFPKYGLLHKGGEGRSFQLGKSVYQGVTHIQRPHNDYLWIWSESGPVGLLCFLGVFGAALLRISRNLRMYKSPEDLAFDLLSLFGIVAYLTFSLTDFPLERTSHMVLLTGLVAIAFRHNTSMPKWRISNSVMMPFLLAAMLFSIVVCYHRWQGEKHTTTVLEANRTRNARQIIPAVDNAVNEFYNMDNFANPLRYYSSIGKLVLKNVNGAFNDAQAALDVHPYNIIALNQMGNVLKARNELDEALQYYERAMEISYRFESARLNMAEIYVRKKDPLKAMKALTLIPYTSPNPKYRDLLGRVLPPLIQAFPEHQMYGEAIEYITQRQPKNRDEYVRYYLEFLEILSKR